MRRLVLFDIDGTILISGGAGRRAFGRALLATFGTEGEINSYRFDGKTDPQILRDLMLKAGIEPKTIESKAQECYSHYIVYIREEIRNSVNARMVPGVLKLLKILKRDKRIVLGLLTGNIEKGAEEKLKRFKLNKFFELGAYGSDHSDRLKLPEIALEKARKSGKNFSAEEICIIGDTEHDIRCAKHIGALSIAVASGNYTFEQLLSLKPDFVFKDFSDIDKVYNAIITN